MKKPSNLPVRRYKHVTYSGQTEIQSGHRHCRMTSGSVRVAGGGGVTPSQMVTTEASKPTTTARFLKFLMSFDMLGYPDLT